MVKLGRLSQDHLLLIAAAQKSNKLRDVWRTDVEFAGESFGRRLNPAISDEPCRWGLLKDR